MRAFFRKAYRFVNVFRCKTFYVSYKQKSLCSLIPFDEYCILVVRIVCVILIHFLPSFCLKRPFHYSKFIYTHNSPGSDGKTFNVHMTVPESEELNQIKSFRIENIDIRQSSESPFIHILN